MQCAMCNPHPYPPGTLLSHWHRELCGRSSAPVTPFSESAAVSELPSDAAALTQLPDVAAVLESASLWLLDALERMHAESALIVRDPDADPDADPTDPQSADGDPADLNGAPDPSRFGWSPPTISSALAALCR